VNIPVAVGGLLVGVGLGLALALNGRRNATRVADAVATGRAGSNRSPSATPTGRAAAFRRVTVRTDAGLTATAVFGQALAAERGYEVGATVPMLRIPDDPPRLVFPAAPANGVSPLAGVAIGLSIAVLTVVLALVS